LSSALRGPSVCYLFPASSPQPIFLPVRSRNLGKADGFINMQMRVTRLTLSAMLLIWMSIASMYSPPALAEEANVPQVVHRLKVADNINAVAWNADGSQLAALSNFGGTITLWNTADWTVINEFHRYPASYAFNSLAFLPDGSLLTAAPLGPYSDDPKYGHSSLIGATHYDSLQIFSLIDWNPEVGKPVRYIPDLGDPPKDLSIKVTDTFAVSPEGSRVAGSSGPKAFLYDSQKGVLIRAVDIPGSDNARSVAFSPDGKTVAVGTMDGKVYFFDSHDGALHGSFDAYPDSGGVRVLDPQTHEQVTKKAPHYSCSALAFSPDGELIAVGRSKNFNIKTPDLTSTTIWRVKDDTLIASLDGLGVPIFDKQESAPVHSLSWNPQKSVLAIADGTSLRLWQIDGSTRKLLLSEKVFPHGFYSNAFSSQGMLAAAENNEIIVYQ
jgi:WD40 repeat protein